MRLLIRTDGVRSLENVGVTEGMGKGLKIVTLRLVRQQLERGSVWEMKGKVARVQAVRTGPRVKPSPWDPRALLCCSHRLQKAEEVRSLASSAFTYPRRQQ